MLKYTWLHVESTTRCNAWCPFCPRNNNGFGLAPNLVIEDLSLARLQEVLFFHKNIQTIQFCGNLGDPLAAKNFDQQIELVLSFPQIKIIQIHTNGALRDQKWWESLVDKTKNIELKVWFAIDGKGKNHNLYRQGTDYNKVIDNAKTFIQAGGHAVWQFILFEHNKNDVIDCYNLSQTMNFKDFKLIKNIRSDNKSYHYRTGKPLGIKNVESDKIVRTYKNAQNTTVLPKNCMHISYPSLYLSASGNLYPCCYLNGKNYTPEDIKESFATKQFNQICLTYCGNQIS